MTRRHRTCPACSERPDRLRAYRWRGRAYCTVACRDSVRDAYAKAEHDLKDRTRRICRCPGAPMPIYRGCEECANCATRFSAGVLEMLREREQRRPRFAFIRRLLYAELHLPRIASPI